MGRGLRVFLVRLLAFSFVLELILVPAILYWPHFERNVKGLRAFMPLLKGQDIAGMLEVTGITGYVILQHFFKGCNVLGVPAAVLFAMGAVAGEVHRGTLEIWMARPVSRRRLLFERWCDGALAIVLSVFLTTLSLPYLLGLVDEELALKPMLLCAAHASSLLLMIYSMTFLLSTLGRRPILIAFVMLSLTISQGAVYIVQEITHYSLFRLVDIPQFLWIFENQSLKPGVVLPLLGTSFALLLASLAVFERRVP